MMYILASLIDAFYTHTHIHTHSNAIIYTARVPVLLFTFFRRATFRNRLKIRLLAVLKRRTIVFKYHVPLHYSIVSSTTIAYNPSWTLRGKRLMNLCAIFIRVRL